jgi:hypothetical protein
MSVREEYGGLGEIEHVARGSNGHRYDFGRRCDWRCRCRRRGHWRRSSWRRAAGYRYAEDYNADRKSLHHFVDSREFLNHAPASSAYRWHLSTSPPVGRCDFRRYVWSPSRSLLQWRNKFFEEECREGGTATQAGLRAQPKPGKHSAGRRLASPTGTKSFFCGAVAPVAPQGGLIFVNRLTTSASLSRFFVGESHRPRRRLRTDRRSQMPRICRWFLRQRGH